MSQPLDEKRIIEVISSLSPGGKRKALRKLLVDLGELDRLVDMRQEKLRAICREKGIDFSSLGDEGREELIDRILHGE